MRSEEFYRASRDNPKGVQQIDQEGCCGAQYVFRDRYFEGKA